MVTSGYVWVLVITSVYQVMGVTCGCKWLRGLMGVTGLQMVTGGYEWLQGVTCGYVWLRVVDRGYRWLQVETGGYVWLQVVWVVMSGYNW